MVKLIKVALWVFRWELLGMLCAWPFVFLAFQWLDASRASAAFWTSCVCGCIGFFVIAIRALAGLHYVSRRRARERERWAR